MQNIGMVSKNSLFCLAIAPWPKRSLAQRCGLGAAQPQTKLPKAAQGRANSEPGSIAAGKLGFA